MGEPGTSATVEEITSRLERYSTSMVVDAMIQQRVLRPESTVLTGLHRFTSSRPRIAGRARTQRFELIRERGAAALVRDRPLHFRLVDEAQPGDILVISAPDAGGFAVFGGILAAQAALRGVVGVIVDGLTRDIDECVDHDLTVWARGATPIPGGHGDYSVVEVNGPVACGGVQVCAGDWILADSDGIVAIPDVHVYAVMEECEAVTAREDKALKAIRDGAALREAFPSRSYYGEA